MDRSSVVGPMTIKKNIVVSWTFARDPLDLFVLAIDLGRAIDITDNICPGDARAGGSPLLNPLLRTSITRNIITGAVGCAFSDIHSLRRHSPCS